jgi:hypothetical protein
MILSTRPQLIRLSERLIFKSQWCHHPDNCEWFPAADFIERIDLRELEAFSSSLRSYLGLDFEPFTVSVSDEVTTLQTVNPLVGGDPEDWIVKEEVAWEWNYPTCGSLFIERVEYWLQLIKEHEPPKEAPAVASNSQNILDSATSGRDLIAAADAAAVRAGWPGAEVAEPVKVVEVIETKPTTPPKKRGRQIDVHQDEVIRELQVSLENYKVVINSQRPDKAAKTKWWNEQGDTGIGSLKEFETKSKSLNRRLSKSKKTVDALK